jgi:VanZ family protein
MTAGRHRSSATLLALAYAMLVLYASLYPFEGWRWPPGQNWRVLLALPTAVHQSVFDVVSNLLGYMPLGGLLTVAALRSGQTRRQATLRALFLASALSYGCELLQHFVPARVPAREDLAMNAAGAVLGVLVALAVHRMGLVDWWHRLRQRWFAGDAAVALALLVLWPVGLLFPAPVPLGLGQVGEKLRAGLAEMLDGVSWAESAVTTLLAAGPPATPLGPMSEVALIGLGLMAPCAVAFSVVAPGWRRWAMASGALALACAAMSLSTALNFGPQHAWGWFGPRSGPGLAFGLVLALLITPLSRRLVAGVGLVVLTGLVVGVAQAPEDPFFALSLQNWEQGQFVRFHGLAQWIGWLWPYAAMAWLMSRLAGRN